MSKLIIPVGVPGSGKSTLAATIPGAVVLSSDDIREELFGDANLQYTEEFAAKKIKQKKIDTSELSEEKLLGLKIQLCNASVFGTLNYRVKKALKEGKDVVYDATNISVKTRKSILKSFNGLYDSAEAYFFDIPIEVAIERNSKRERKVPVEVIERMFKDLAAPTKSEGFSEVHIITA